MQLVGLLSVLVYCGASLVVGIRLLRLASRSHELPERLIGLAFLVGGVVGFPAMIAAGVLGQNGSPAAKPGQAVGSLAIGLGAVLLLVFWRHVFAPSLRGGRALLTLWSSAMAACIVAMLVRVEPGGGIPDDWSYGAVLAVQGGVYALNCFASTRTWLRVRRRVPLGLASPVVANRILLWGLSGLGVVLQYGYTLLLMLAPETAANADVYRGVLSALGLYSAVVITLAFFPPRAYLRWLQPEAGAPGSTASL